MSFEESRWHGQVEPFPCSSGSVQTTCRYHASSGFCPFPFSLKMLPNFVFAISSNSNANLYLQSRGGKSDQYRYPPHNAPLSPDLNHSRAPSLQRSPDPTLEQLHRTPRISSTPRWHPKAHGGDFLCTGSTVRGVCNWDSNDSRPSTEISADTDEKVEQ